MNLIETRIKDLLVLEPKVFADGRGYFFESYNKKTLESLIGKEYNFVQDNESKSSYGVIRGLHYQLAPYSQAKLVRILEGRVYDVAVDLRKDSPTFGKWEGVELSGENKKQFLIPKGFAHGFSVLSETAVFAYKCDEYYRPEAEAGVIYNDPSLNIDWKIPEKDAKLSEKDKFLPELKNAKMNFCFEAIIEHTNFLPFEDYGEHLIYVTSYFQKCSDEVWQQSDKEVLESYIKGIESMFPSFSYA